MNILLSLLALVAAEPTTALPSREQAIATLDRHGRMTEAYFECIYAADKNATARLVDTTDPYFFLQADHPAIVRFGQEIPASTIYMRCMAVAANALPDQKSGTISFDFRSYRNWAARRLYVERYPTVANIGGAKWPRRPGGNYGPNSGPVDGILRTVDCAVKRDPVTADWLVRYGNPNQLHLDDEFRAMSEKLWANFNHCSDRRTPDNGTQELMNNLAGLVADSLLRMADDRKPKGTTHA